MAEYVKSKKATIDWSKLDKEMGMDQYSPQQTWSYHFFDNVLYVHAMPKRSFEENQKIALKMKQTLIDPNKQKISKCANIDEYKKLKRLLLAKFWTENKHITTQPYAYKPTQDMIRKQFDIFVISKNLVQFEIKI